VCPIGNIKDPKRHSGTVRLTLQAHAKLAQLVRGTAYSILLTGGAGFIGSHLAEALLQKGLRLAIVDELNHFYSPEIKKANLAEVRQVGDFEFFQSDICDRYKLREAFEGAQPDIVVHLAARAGVLPSLKDPELYERVNVAGTLNLLELCREFKVPKFVFGSSSSVYGVAEQVPFKESNTELRPISPYAATKFSGEMLSFTYAHLYGLEVICLRFFTVYGPRQRPDLAIHKFTELIEAGSPIPIYGDGSTGRDYTFVSDIVSGLLAALEYHPESGVGNARFDIINLGNSHPVTLNQLVEMLETAVGKRAIRKQLPPQPGDVPITWADISKAKRLLGYDPQTPIEKGLAEFVSWFRRTNSRLKVV
jgi:UDP-glucuronate 4-epimerase